jgi:hypothetical protein
MASYSQTQLNLRHNILQTQLIFGKFLTTDIVHVLINLFDDLHNSFSEKISKYVIDERLNRGLSNNNINIKGEMYGSNDNNSTLYLGIYKDGKLFLHLSIHLVLTKLYPQDAGMIHFYKNVYEYEFPSKRKIKPAKQHLYALIGVKQTKNAPNSLIFYIADGFDTPNIIPAVKQYDQELQIEMDVIISVLNRLFDETNTEFYIGHMVEKLPIHNNINNMLANINVHNVHYTRKNKGKYMFQPSPNVNPMRINYSNYKPKPKKNPSRSSRKANKTHK